MNAITQTLSPAALAEKSWLAVYADLFKARLTFLVLLTTHAGFYVGLRGPVDYLLMLHTLVGTALVAGGAAALNQLWERTYDARMRRTRDRPLPSGRLQPQTVLVVGVVSVALGLTYLALGVNLRTSLLGAFSLLSYLCIYTPLKRVTWLNRNGTAKSWRTGRGCAAASAIAITLAVIPAPLAAHADGGVVRAKETRGAFVITIFSPPGVSIGLPADVTVMVQRRDTGEVMMDATVELNLVAPTSASPGPNDLIFSPAKNSRSPTAAGAPGRPASIRATRAQAANKLLYAASVAFPEAGDWQLRVTVREGGDETSVSCVLPVEMPPRLPQSLWPSLALPPFAIALFTMNQWLRRRTAATVRV